MAEDQRTTKQTAPQVRPQRPPATVEVSDEPITHLIAHSRRAEGFRRAGLRFERKPQLFAIAEMSATQLALIENEQQVVSRRVTASEAAEFARADADLQISGASEMSPAQIAQALLTLQSRIRKLEDENAELRNRLSGADRPPRVGEPAPGQ